MRKARRGGVVRSDIRAFSVAYADQAVRLHLPEAPSGCHTGALRSEARRVRSTRVTGAPA